VLRLIADRGTNAAPAEPRLHFSDLALLLHDDRFRELSRPGILRMPKSHPSHVDRPLMMRDHLDAKVHVRIARVGKRHVSHHTVMGGFELAGGWRVVRSVRMSRMARMARMALVAVAVSGRVGCASTSVRQAATRQTRGRITISFRGARSAR
jgi:hypothetical protein